MLDFSKLGSVVLVTYKMNDNTVHKVTFDNIREAMSFRGSCSMFIRRAIITDFSMQEISKISL